MYAVNGILFNHESERREVDQLLSDPSKARDQLGWNPSQTSFPELVRIMVRYDMDYFRQRHIGYGQTEVLVKE